MPTERRRAILMLLDGSMYEGFSFGAESDALGEVVFSTSMTGYQEMLTDPSFAGQILMPTYPLIGNYGVNESDNESNRIQARGFIVREECQKPDNYQSSGTIDSFLRKDNIPGIWGLDTRAVTRKLRNHGVMMGIITSTKTPVQALSILQNTPDYGATDYVKEVSISCRYEWQPQVASNGLHIAIMDCGCKYNIMRILKAKGCKVTVLPVTAPASDYLDLHPDGILLSPGPGDPALLEYVTVTVKKLVGKQPMMGICLGHQLLVRAFGGKTFKLKFGHRGGNHPVKELKNGRVHITSQNHGYAVDGDSLPAGLEATHIHLNDGTVEGMRHSAFPIFSVQYHAEASPGPLDNTYIFDEFITNVRSK